MNTPDGGIYEGCVRNVSPIDIVLKDEEKFHIYEKMLTIPKELSDYDIDITIPDYNGTSRKATGKVHNSLKVGDSVVLVSCNNNKQFLVIGRV